MKRCCILSTSEW